MSPDGIIALKIVLGVIISAILAGTFFYLGCRFAEWLDKLDKKKRR